MFQEISTQECFQTRQIVHSANQQTKEEKQEAIQEKAKNIRNEGIELLRKYKSQNPPQLPVTDPDGSASHCVFELERFKFLLEFFFEEVRFLLVVI